MAKDGILTQVEKMKDWLVDIRRDFHKHPELSTKEFRTHDTIINHLEELGIEYEANVADTGVVGIIRGTKEGKTVALRGDIDALPITEQNDVSYKSTNEGVMHACGHDAHTTIVLGAAKYLQENRDSFAGCVKLFFQPAEETVGGAKRMIEAGVMENPKVDAVFGLHVDTFIPTGEIGVRYGQMNASTDTVTLTIKGESAHGAYPQNGVDAIVIAAHVIQALQSIVSRNVDPRDSAVVTLGVIEGGTQSNIIANEVKITGTVRTLSNETRDLILQRIEDILAHTTKTFGADYEFELDPHWYIALTNNDDMVDIVKESGKSLLGAEKVLKVPQASLGGEDFSFFADAAPSAFFRLGARNEEKGIVHGGHTEQFNVDEDCLPVGVAMQVQNVLSFLNKA